MRKPVALTLPIQFQNRTLTVTSERPAWVDPNSIGDYVINGSNDLKDCGRFRIKKLKNLPDGAKVKLWVTIPKPKTEPDYFSGQGTPERDPIKAEHRVRIFKPTSPGTLPGRTGEHDTVTSDTDLEIIGPGTSDSVTFIKDGNNSDKDHHDIAILKQPANAEAWTEFAVEGLEFAAIVDVHVQVSLEAETPKSDLIRLKVAPFIAVSHNQPVEKTLLADTPVGFNNSAFNTDFDAKDAILSTRFPDISKWPQDLYEIGYTAMPTTAVPNPAQTAHMTVLLDLPNENTNPGMEHIMADGIGVFYRLNYLGWHAAPENNSAAIPRDSINYGGNIECTPPIGGKPFGRIVVGTAPTPGVGAPGADGNPAARYNLNSELLNLLKGQEIQKPLEVPIEWSDLRHIDEFVSFVPNKATAAKDDFVVIIASPEKAKQMLEQMGPATQFSLASVTQTNPNMVARPMSAPSYLADAGGDDFHPGGIPGYPGVFENVTGYLHANTIIAGHLGNLRQALASGLGLDATSSFVEVPQLFGAGLEFQATCAQAPVANIQIVGTKALCHAAYGPIDSINPAAGDKFAGELASRLAALGYTVEFLPQGEEYTLAQSGVHCASNLIPNVDTTTKPWWK